MTYDVAVIGAGPSGLAFAHELKKMDAEVSLCMIDAGADVPTRVDSLGSKCAYVTGIGGAGLFSDGKLAVPNRRVGLYPIRNSALWEAKPNEHIQDQACIELSEYAMDLIRSTGAKVTLETDLNDELERLLKEIEEHDLELFVYDSYKINPKDLHLVSSEIHKRLVRQGVEFKLHTEVVDIEESDDQSFRLEIECPGKGRQSIRAKKVAIAVGKSGKKFLSQMIRKHRLATVRRPVQLGVRIEMPSRWLARIAGIAPDMQLINRIGDNASVQTFCTCPNGDLVACEYPNGQVLVGGATNETRTANTNFALLVKTLVPNVDMLSIVNEVVNSANKMTNHKPFLQRYSDLLSGEATDKKELSRSEITTTLKEYALIDINMVYPRFFVEAIIDTITKMKRMVPELRDEALLVAGPCLEFCYEKFVLNSSMESSVRNIHVIGDASGFECGIIPSMVSGFVAARGLAASEPVLPWISPELTVRGVADCKVGRA